MTPLGRLNRALRRLRHRVGASDTFPAVTAETTTVPEAGSKRIALTAFFGCGFLHAQSQLTHRPPSPEAALVCECPQFHVF